MYFIKILVIFLIIGSFGNNLFSQTPDEKNFELSDRIFFGGDFALMFGTLNYIEISPRIGYRLSDELSAGVGVIYKHISSRNYYSTVSFSTSIFGGNMFANYMITENIYPHIEFEVLSLERKYFDYIGGFPENGRYFYESLFVGAGYKYPIGANTFITTTFLYNLNHTSNSPYDSPYVWRVGVNF